MAYLVEMTVLDQTGAAKVLRYASASAFMTKPNEVPPNTTYEPRLMNGGSYERHCWQRGATRGTSQIGYGVVTLNNSDGALDWLLTAGVDGQPITIRKGPEAGNYPGDYPPYFSGVMRRVAPQWATVDIYLTDLWGDVGQKSYQSVKFAGTNSGATGLEGLPNDLQGKPKPKLRGTASNFSPPCVNTSSLDFQIDDGTAKLPLTITSLRDKMGSPWVYDGAQASLAAYLAAAPVAGHYTSYAGPEGWYVRLGSQPTKLTVSASEGALPDRTAAQIVSRILSEEGGVALANIQGIAALDAAAPQEVGIWVGDETTLQPLIDSILDSVNGFLTDTRTGLFRLGQLVDPASLQPVANIQEWMVKSKDGLKITGSNDPGVGVLISASVNGSQDRYLNNQDATAGLPCWRVKLNWGRNFTVMTGADVAGAGMVDIAYTALELRTAIASDSSVLAVHKNAPEFTVNTLLVQQADGVAEATRQLSLRKLPRYIVEVPLDPASPLDPNDPAVTMASIDLAKGVKLTMPRFGWDAGKTFFVLGIVEDAGDLTTPATTTLILWG